MPIPYSDPSLPFPWRYSSPGEHLFRNLEVRAKTSLDNVSDVNGNGIRDLETMNDLVLIISCKTEQASSLHIVVDGEVDRGSGTPQHTRCWDRAKPLKL